MRSFRFCPYCGEQYNNDQIESQHKHCEQCGKWVFENLKATGSAVIIQDNKLLLVKRGINPFKGKWDVPGGFSEPEEHPEETTLREVKEELGVDARIIKLWDIYSPIPYDYQGYVQHNCDLYYQVALESTDIVVGDDAQDYKWFALDNLPSEDEMAFISAKKLIQELRSGTSKLAVTNSPE
jgi:NAD+ diphosphatase